MNPIAAAQTLFKTARELLYEVEPTDPLTFSLVVGLLAAVCAVPCAIPAMRAARVDPMLVLRDQ